MFLKIIRCVLPRCKAGVLPPPRAITSAVPLPPLPLFRHVSYTEFCGQPSKLQSTTLRQFSSTLFARNPSTAKDNDAFPLPAPAAQPEERPVFSKKIVDPNLPENSFNRSDEYDTIMGHLNGHPSKVLVLLKPKHTGNTVSRRRRHRQLSIDTILLFIFSLILTHYTSPASKCTTLLSN